MAHGMKMGYPRFSHSFVNGGLNIPVDLHPSCRSGPQISWVHLDPTNLWLAKWTMIVPVTVLPLWRHRQLKSTTYIVYTSNGLFQILGEYSQMAFVTWKNENPPYGFGFFPRFSDKPIWLPPWYIVVYGFWSSNPFFG